MELLDKKEFAVAAYKPFYDQLQELEKNNTAIAFYYESAKGNKEARSHVYKLRQSKAALEKTRKDEKAESLRIGKAIDSEAKEIESRIEAMIAVHQVKLDEIEKRETDRIAKIELRLEALSEIHHEGTAADYRYHLATLEQIKIDDSWQEFAVEASQAKDQSIAKHRELLAAREKADAEAAELEALRKAAAEHEQRDRDEKIAQEAAAKALRDQQAAIEAERKRVADEAEQAVREQAKREADTKHKSAVNRAALAAMVENGISEECAKQCIKLIAQGKVPLVSIVY